MAEGRLVGIFSPEEFLRSSHAEVRAFVAAGNGSAADAPEP
jgi:hypothetical protein